MKARRMMNNRKSPAPLTRLLILLGAVLIPILPACQTMKGAGRDIEQLGENIEESAEEHD